MNNKIETIEVWTNECYSCHSKKYDAVMRFVIDNMIRLDKYQVIRIPLKREWIWKANEYRAKQNVESPFIVIKLKEGEEIVESVKNFADKAEEIRKKIMTVKQEEPEKTKKKTTKRPAKKIMTKTASIKKDDEEVVEKAE